MSGVIATVNTSAGANVNKGDALLTVYTMDTLQVEISVNEYDLSAIAVASISRLSATQSGEAAYQAYIDFTPNEQVRIGMTAVVTTLDE